MVEIRNTEFLMLQKHAERNSGTIPTKVQTKRQLHHDNHIGQLVRFTFRNTTLAHDAYRIA